MTAGDRSGWLGWLARRNLTAVFVATVVVVLVGLFAPGIVGAAVLLLLAAALAAIMTLTWAVQPPRTRALRLLMLTLLVAVAVAKIL